MGVDIYFASKHFLAPFATQVFYDQGRRRYPFLISNCVPNFAKQRGIKEGQEHTNELMESFF